MKTIRDVASEFAYLSNAGHHVTTHHIQALGEVIKAAILEALIEFWNADLDSITSGVSRSPATASPKVLELPASPPPSPTRSSQASDDAA